MRETNSTTPAEVLEQARLRLAEKMDSIEFYADLKRRAINYGYDPEYVESEVEKYRANEVDHEDKAAYRALMRNAMCWLYQDKE